jgi:hypothetical protein
LHNTDIEDHGNEAIAHMQDDQPEDLLNADANVEYFSFDLATKNALCHTSTIIKVNFNQFLIPNWTYLSEHVIVHGTKSNIKNGPPKSLATHSCGLLDIAQ